MPTEDTNTHLVNVANMIIMDIKYFEQSPLLTYVVLEKTFELFLNIQGEIQLIYPIASNYVSISKYV